MPSIQFVHWDPSEAQLRADRIRALGYEVNYDVKDVTALLRRLRENPPLAVVIDLSRSPSQGRDFAMALRHYKTTRGVPLVMVGGDPIKVEKIRSQVPDAVYTGWDQIASGVEKAITNPPKEPVVVRTLFDGYAGHPLPKKLGIRAGSQVALVNPPAGFHELLGALPDGVRFYTGVPPREEGARRYDLVIWFVLAQAELQRCIAEMATRMDFGSLWIAWPKKGSGLGEGVVQQDVRATGLAAGLVDYKICSIDSTWTGLLFTRRKSPRTTTADH